MNSEVISIIMILIFKTCMVILVIALLTGCLKIQASNDMEEIKQRIVSEFLSRQSNERVIVIDKINMKLSLYEDEELLTGYPVPIALGFDPVASKVQRGDGRTPEGEYFIYARHLSASFSFFVEISYPGYHDVERGLRDQLITEQEARRIRQGLANLDGGIRGTALGDAIGIHTTGSRLLGSFSTFSNWTLGCIALEYDDMEKLYNQIRIRDRVLILGEEYIRNYAEQNEDSISFDH